MIELRPDEYKHLVRLEIMYAHLRRDAEEACGLPSYVTALFADWLGELVADLQEPGNWLV